MRSSLNCRLHKQPRFRDFDKRTPAVKDPYTTTLFIDAPHVRQTMASFPPPLNRTIRLCLPLPSAFRYTLINYTRKHLSQSISPNLRPAYESINDSGKCNKCNVTATDRLLWSVVGHDSGVEVWWRLLARGARLRQSHPAVASRSGILSAMAAPSSLLLLPLMLLLLASLGTECKARRRRDLGGVALVRRLLNGYDRRKCDDFSYIR